MKKSKQFQGSKRKAREAAYQARQREKEEEKKKRAIIAHGSIEAVAKVMGIRLD